MSLLLPALANARDAGRTVQCLSNEKQQDLALNLYAGENRDYTPPAYVEASFVITYIPSYGANNAFISDSVLLGQYTGNGTGLQQKDGRLITPKAGIWYCPNFSGTRFLLNTTYNKYSPAHRVFITLKETAGWSQLWRLDSVARPSALLFSADSGEREHWEPGEPVPTPYYGITDVDAEAYNNFSVNPSPTFRRNRRLRHNSNTTTNFSFIDGHAATLKDPEADGLSGKITIKIK